jgi:acyl carrier protein phosphodiesterase
MNFLAHIYLSGDSKEIIIGNFIADGVRLKDHSSFSPGILKGIKLHHKIDEFTDSHPIVTLSKNRLRPKYGKYASVIVDIFYDHFLAVNWSHYSRIPLPEYAENVYLLMTENLMALPARVHHFLPYMISGNWLANYAYIEGIESTLLGMSRRASFESGMELAIEDLKRDYDLYQKEFLTFFPELQQFVTSLKDK